MGDHRTGHGLPYARTARVASLAVRQGFNSNFGIGACLDRPVRDAGASRDAIPASQRQRIGFYITQVYGARQKLWFATRVHHAALPATKRYDGAIDPITQRAMRPPPALREPRSRQSRYQRLDHVLQQRETTSGSCHEDTSRGIQISSLT